MNIFENWKNLIDKARKLDRRSLEAIRFGLFGGIVVDLFGIYWYLKLKALGGALLIVLIIGLTLTLLLERGLPAPPKKPIKKIKKEVKKMPEENQEQEEYMDLSKEQEPKEVEQEQGSPFGNFDIGLPSAEEFQERSKKAMGTLGDF